MNLNLKVRVVEFLQQNPEQKFTARQIAEWILKKYPKECDEKKKRSNVINSKTALIQQLVAEISTHRPIIQKKNNKIKTTESRPKKYYFTEASDSSEIEYSEQIEGVSTTQDKLTEHDLYPLLTKYLKSELSVLSKRIDESRSSNNKGKNGNKWLYPDIVGMENLSQDWNREIIDCVKQYADKKTKLYSFEVKILINRSNIREAFFQAVSNSSWANLGYLVANELSGDETIKELRILSSLHGIGFILLDNENVSESQILIPAKEKLEIDWNTANRLAEENKDFLKYIKLVRKFYQTGNVHDKEWD
jgi:hypothetical protein